MRRERQIKNRMTDATWNPIRGCSRVSEGCRNCYAERFATRFRGPGEIYDGLTIVNGSGDPQWTGEVKFIPELLDQPLHWKRPRKIFVNSMSDLFHEKVKDETICRIFAVMALSPEHTFQVLTKRPSRMLGFMIAGLAAADNRRWIQDILEEEFHDRDAAYKLMDRWPLSNVWLGVSVEDQKTADERIPLLLQTPAAVRWVSYEPALGPINFRCIKEACEDHDNYFDAIGGIRSIRPCLDWIVAGGESGPGARPMHPDWARAVRDQCQDARVPFFFKQWGEWISLANWPDAEGYDPKCTFIGKNCDGGLMLRVGKKRAGHKLDGEVLQQFPSAKAVSA